jgi:hypothetical protein
MRDGWKSRWGLRVSAVVLVGGLLVLGTGNVVTQAGERDDNHNQRNPFQRILDKLDDILDAIKGGGAQDGNHTLRWDTNHPSASRFTTAFPGAVLDKNTGLVWEQAPDATVRVWSSISEPLGARNYCVNKNVGGTRGWRLPSVAELASLIDPSLPAPHVPSSVFTGVQSVYYWSATTSLDDLSPRLWGVDFSIGDVSPVEKFGNNTGRPAWCVRGPMQESVY